MSERLNDQNIKTEIEKYNRKVESLTDKFLAKMHGFLSLKKQEVHDIDRTVVELGHRKEQTIGDIDELTQTIRRNEERSGKAKVEAVEHDS